MKVYNAYVKTFFNKNVPPILLCNKICKNQVESIEWLRTKMINTGWHSMIGSLLGKDENTSFTIAVSDYVFGVAIEDDNKYEKKEPKMNINVIYKYKLDLTKRITTIDLPCDSKILTAQEQDGDIVVWVLHGRDETLKTPVEFVRALTGSSLICLCNHKYLNTIQQKTSGYVFHIFFKKSRDVKEIG